MLNADANTSLMVRGNVLMDIDESVVRYIGIIDGLFFLINFTSILLFNIMQTLATYTFSYWMLSANLLLLRISVWSKINKLEA